MKKRAIITGIYGQDAAYLSKYLLEDGYEVVGTYRRNASGDSWRLRELGIDGEIELAEIELLEFSNILSTINKIRPTEIYNLAAQSFVATSFEQPIYTAEVDALAVTRILEAIRIVDGDIRFYQASTSEMFGQVRETPQTEETPFHPRSPYGVAKLYGFWITKNYREAYDLKAGSGILFNHESPLRGSEFVTRKITATLALIANGQREVLELGNMAAARDWGHAKDFVRGMHMMMQQDNIDDYVLGTGRCHTVEEFVALAAPIYGFNLAWEGEGETRAAIDRDTGKQIIRVNSKFYRPAEVDTLISDASKARKDFGWQPEITFEELVTEMAEADIKRVKAGQFLL